MLFCFILLPTARANFGFQVLCKFFASSNTAPTFPNELIEAGNGIFFGTAGYGGTNNNGAIFKVDSTGAMANIFTFNGWNGGNPVGLTLGRDGNLYGATCSGGPDFGGTIFRITTNGNFLPLATSGQFTYFFLFGGTNGQSPCRGLIETEDGKFYGTTSQGGDFGDGTIFSITTNGLLTSLFQFNGTNGAGPSAGLTLGKDGNLYGTTAHGGNNYVGVLTGNGTVFKISTNGTFATLVFFNGTNGSKPMGRLMQASNGNFYGTTRLGGTFNLGTIFQITTNGTFTNLISFTGTNGSYPLSGLTQGSDGNFYGMTSSSTANGTNFGTIYRLMPDGTLTTIVNLYGTHPGVEMILGHDGNLYGTSIDATGRWMTDGSSGYVFRLIFPPANTADGSATSFTNSSLNATRRL